MLLLRELGHEVHGYSLNPLSGSLFERARLSELCDSDIRSDIRDSSRLQTEILRVNPDVIIHLAAQPLVRYGYEHPEETFRTNFDGTLNVLSAAQRVPKLTALVVVTTDKVYENTGKKEGYVETDPLGGLDPYSASKAAADILSQSWSHTFPDMPIAIARAGNVLGAGDVSKDRLVPDMLSAFEDKNVAAIRNPDSVRPWQHVLDCLNGYLSLVARVQSKGASGSWNFGPDPENFQPVSVVADYLAEAWGEGVKWSRVSELGAPGEDKLLTLNSHKASSQLGWKNKYSLGETLHSVATVERSIRQGQDAMTSSKKEVKAFLSAK